jgi:hypothetical protein
MSKPKEAREPVQVYLDARDRTLLDAMAKRESIPRSDVLRLALRRLSAELLGQDRPGAALSSLVGVLDAAPSVPTDLAERHDDYLYTAVPLKKPRGKG